MSFSLRYKRTPISTNVLCIFDTLIRVTQFVTLCRAQQTVSCLKWPRGYGAGPDIKRPGFDPLLRYKFSCPSESIVTFGAQLWDSWTYVLLGQKLSPKEVNVLDNQWL